MKLLKKMKKKNYLQVKQYFLNVNYNNLFLIGGLTYP